MNTKCEYRFNPHRHVKIWLSRDPSQFMHQENQLRLVKMRVDCPNDSIHLVYDRRLLNSTAQANLLNFCREHALYPLDVQSLLEQSSLTPNELLLVEIYDDEMSHLDQGGDLAAASDILRWLKPIFSLGTYSDIDVTVRTKDLPETITVHSELLLNLGSYYSDDSGHNEKLIINNDLIAILNPDSERIARVQQRIIQNYRPAKIEVFLYHCGWLHEHIIQETQTQYCELMTPREFRKHLNDIMDIIIRKSIIQAALLQEDPEIAKILKDKQEKFSYFSYMETILYAQSVIHSSGPVAVLAALDPQNEKTQITPALIDAKIKPFSFASNAHLLKAFISNLQCILHAPSKKQLESDNSGGDAFWTREGKKQAEEREATYHQAAQKIRKSMRFFLHQKTQPSFEARRDNTTAQTPKHKNNRRPS